MDQRDAFRGCWIYVLMPLILSSAQSFECMLWIGHCPGVVLELLEFVYVERELEYVAPVEESTEIPVNAHFHQWVLFIEE